MRLFFKALMRTIAISIAYGLTTFVTAAFLTFVLFLDSDTSWVQEDLFAAGGAIVFLVTMWFTLAYLAFFPFVVIVGLFEITRMGSALSNILAGGLLAVIVGFMFDTIAENGETILPYSDQKLWLTFIAAGFVGGFAYWCLAGHRAGRWLGSPIPTASEEI